MSCGARLANEMRRRGFRVTAQRHIILETIAHKGGHLTAHEVFEKASQRLPGLNLATVYRTVEALHAAGLVDLLPTTSDAMRFSLHDPENPHGHLVCRTCGRVEELTPELVAHLAEQIEGQTNFSIDRAHLTLEGQCASCRRAAEVGPA